MLFCSVTALLWRECPSTLALLLPWLCLSWWAVLPEDGELQQDPRSFDSISNEGTTGPLRQPLDAPGPLRTKPWGP